MRALLDFDPLSSSFSLTQGAELDNLIRSGGGGGAGTGAGTGAVPIPPDHHPDTPIGEQLAKIFRNNYTDGIGIERAVVGNGTFMWPIILDLFNAHPDSRVVDLWPAARIALREYFVAQLTLRPVVDRVAIGNKLYACRVRVGTNPGATILRWLQDTSMIPTINAESINLLESLRNVSSKPSHDECFSGVEFGAGLVADEVVGAIDSLPNDERLYQPAPDTRFGF